MNFKNNITAIIPAAGGSRRFNSNKSKIFFLIKKKKMIQIILEKINNFADKLIVVLNAKDNDEFNKVKNKLYFKNKISVVFQKKPKGMAQAISIALKKVSTPNFFVIWSDQIYLKKQTIKHGLKIHSLKKYLTFPIVWKKNPYTLVIKKNRKFKNIIQQREVTFKLDSGYADCGYFIGNTKYFQDKLKLLIKSKKILTKMTKEYDFLHSFKYINKSKIKTYVINSEKESRGINYRHDIT